MRNFIILAEHFANTPSNDEVEYVEEPVKEPELNPALMHDLGELCSRMRAFMETESSDEYALGIETGMQRAADMIENLVRRYSTGDAVE